MHASSLCLPGLGGTLHGGVHMGWGVPTTQQQPRCAPASWGAREPQHPTLHKGSSSSMVQPRLTGGGGCSPTGRRSPPPQFPQILMRGPSLFLSTFHHRPPGSTTPYRPDARSAGLPSAPRTLQAAGGFIYLFISPILFIYFFCTVTFASPGCYL